MRAVVLALAATITAALLIGAPLVLVLQRHIIQLEIRTTVLCPKGLPPAEPVPIGPDGCIR